MRRLHKQPVGQYNPWDDTLESGDRVYKPMTELEGAHMLDLVESNGWHKRTSGELSSVTVKKNGVPRIAVLDDKGIWRWKE